jgi:hypothetical protein
MAEADRPAPTESSSVPGLVDRWASPGPQVAVELRPPPAGLSPAESMEAWIDMHHTLRRLSRSDRAVFITDNAVATREEENLAHLTANLPDGVRPSGVVPFLTCKHTLEHCLLYASRASAAGFEALAVLGGDTFGGLPRCLPHAYLLRQRIRERVPALLLGGWVNPHRDATEQVGFLADEDFGAEFVLSQVVSHHCLPGVEALRNEMERRNVRLPVVFGVFCYRSANPRTLARLGEYFPVPAAEITREFEGGDSADQICARSIRALREVGAENVYVSNLGFRGVESRLRRILQAV